MEAESNDHESIDGPIQEVHGIGPIQTILEQEAESNDPESLDVGPIQEVPHIGPIQAILLQEAADKRRLSQRLQQQRQRTGGLWKQRRSSVAESEPDGRRRSTFLDPTWLSAFRERQALEQRSLHSVDIDAEDAATTATSGDSGETASSSQDSGESRSSIWQDFHRRSSTFVEEREQFLETLRQQKEEAELQECTFEPTVPAAPMREDTSTRPKGASSMYVKSMQQQAVKEERLRKLRAEQADRELAECSFKPAPRRPRPSSQQRPTTPAASPACAASPPTDGKTARGSYAANVRRSGVQTPRASSKGHKQSVEQSPRTCAGLGRRPCPGIIAGTHIPPARPSQQQAGLRPVEQRLPVQASVSLAVDRMDSLLKGLILSQ